MTWAEGDHWSVAVDLPPGVYEFKLVAALGHTGEAVEWEAGDNRQLTARPPGYCAMPTACCGDTPMQGRRMQGRRQLPVHALHCGKHLFTVTAHHQRGQ